MKRKMLNIVHKYTNYKYFSYKIKNKSTKPSFPGLWSNDKGTACPADDKTALESPALAQYKVLSSVMIATTAVQPERSTTLGSDFI